jgi:hypothetical protein
MHIDIASLDRRHFLRGSSLALALPWLETWSRRSPRERPRRFACIYQPDGVPMPLRDDPAFEDWSWFPHGADADFRLTKCLASLEPLRGELSVFSGLSHPAVRAVHGHSNADQFLTGADTGARGDYRNSISLDQAIAAHVGDHTRYTSLVMSSDGGTGTARGAHTLSFDRNGRPIPAAHRPKKIFDSLFVTSDEDAGRRLSMSGSALDDLLEDARALRQRLSKQDQGSLDQYLDAVRETEQKIEKARRWVGVPLPQVHTGELRLEATPDEARAYVQAMLGMIRLAFQTDSTRVATYQIGRENGVGISDHLSRAVGFELAHQLSHETKQPDGWKNFGIYCHFLAEEVGRLVQHLKDTPEPGGEGSVLDNTLILFGSASSAFHLSRNYPLILFGGKHMGFRHGRYHNHAGVHAYGGAWSGGREPWQEKFEHDDLPLGELYLTILRRMGVTAAEFAGCRKGMDEV